MSVFPQTHTHTKLIYIIMQRGQIFAKLCAYMEHGAGSIWKLNKYFNRLNTYRQTIFKFSHLFLRIKPQYCVPQYKIHSKRVDHSKYIKFHTVNTIHSKYINSTVNAVENLVMFLMQYRTFTAL